MKIVVVGGHLSPALAVIEKLKNSQVFYIGRKHTFEGDSSLSFEYHEMEKLKIPFFSISAARLQRKFTKHTFPSLAKFPLGFFQSFKILRKLKPDVVLGFGGYLFLPVTMAAYALRIPVVVHEQTLEAGFTNKLVAKLAKRICIAWKSSEKFFPKSKTVFTGNPLREEFIKLKKAKREENKIPLIYIVGGSSGSHAINVLVEQTLDKLLKQYKVIHQIGASEVYKDFERLESKKSESYDCRKFLRPQEAAHVMQQADLVVCRAGINTVTELIYLNKPAFLIPLSAGQKNEQLKNAIYFKSLGLGEFIEQDKLTPELFISTISSMLKNSKNFKLKEAVLNSDAADEIVAVLEDVAKKKT